MLGNFILKKEIIINNDMHALFVHKQLESHYIHQNNLKLIL